MIYVISKKDIQGDSGLSIRNLFDTYGNKMGFAGFSFDEFEYEYAGINHSQNLEPYSYVEVKGSHYITISSPAYITNILKELLKLSHVDNDKMWCIDVREYSNIFRDKLELFKKEILRIKPNFQFTKPFIGIDLLGNPFQKNSKFGKEINIHSAMDRLQGSYSSQGQTTNPNISQSNVSSLYGWYVDLEDETAPISIGKFKSLFNILQSLQKKHKSSFKFTHYGVDKKGIAKLFCSNDYQDLKKIDISDAISKLELIIHNFPSNITGIDFASQGSNDVCTSTIVSNNTTIIDDARVFTPVSNDVAKSVDTKKKSRYKFYNLF